MISLISCIVIHNLLSRCLCLPTNLNSLQEDSVKIHEDMIIKKIKELEQHKNELFRDIHKAMEESVVALKKSNVSNAERGVSYIENLKMEIKNIGKRNQGPEYKTVDENSIVDLRRHNQRGEHHHHHNKKKNADYVKERNIQTQLLMLREANVTNNVTTNVTTNDGLTLPTHSTTHTTTKFIPTVRTDREDVKYLLKAEADITRFVIIIIN